jgi:hypothetical protein
VLAHEFQHMVHFNERVLVRGALGQEALWLSEGLAQMAEELVARAYDALGDGNSAQLFRAGAVQRARRYLVGPDTVSVVVTSGQGSLAERGAGFLNVLYLEDQLGMGMLRDLTQTTRSGVANVELETGRAWPELLADWWAATYLDGPGVESGPLTYPTSICAATWVGSFRSIRSRSARGTRARRVRSGPRRSATHPVSPARRHRLGPPWRRIRRGERRAGDAAPALVRIS